MGAVVEVKYFNTFILKKTNNDDEPIWNGSFGIPEDIGGYPVLDPLGGTGDYNWAIEESRIKGGYNNTSVVPGVKAHIVEEETRSANRINSLIYSGIFNSRTGINNTNVFSVGEPITKSADPVGGSIQRLYAQDTNLVIFQEHKVSRALIDKDAIYSAEGGGAVTSSNLVIGTIQPYIGEYGISKNPESFAVYGYAKYFSDQNNNVILRLSNNGIEEISANGMKDYFRDRVNDINSSSGGGIIIGGYDTHNSQYVVSTQTNPLASMQYETLSFDEAVKGWVSFYSYGPDQMFSVRNKFYTVKDDKMWQHYSTAVNRGNFYGTNYATTVSVILNPAPSNSKNFQTIAYEGSNGWKVNSIVSDETGQNFSTTSGWQPSVDQSSSIYSYYEGEYVINPADDQPVVRADYNTTFGTTDPDLSRYHAGFNRKENKYVSSIKNNSAAMEGEIIWGNSMSGIKGYYINATFSTDSTTDQGGEKQLFSVESSFVMNNGY